MAPAAQPDTKAELMETIDTVFTRLARHRNVTGMLVMDRHGAPLRSTFNMADTLNYAQVASDLVMRTERGKVELGMKLDQVDVIRVRIGKREIYIAPESLFTMVVLQDFTSKTDPDCYDEFCACRELSEVSSDSNDDDVNRSAEENVDIEEENEDVSLPAESDVSSF